MALLCFRGAGRDRALLFLSLVEGRVAPLPFSRGRPRVAFLEPGGANEVDARESARDDLGLLCLLELGRERRGREDWEGVGII